MKDAKYMARALPHYFQLAFDIDDKIPQLTSKPQEVDSNTINLIHEILSNIKQQLELVAVDGLSQVPLDDELRMRAICRKFLTAAQTVDAKHEDETMGILQIEKHIKREILVSDCRLLSGCIYLLIASVGRQDMELHSAYVLQNISEALKNVLEVCLVPASRLWKVARTIQLDALLSTYEQVLRLLTTLASDIGLPEPLLLKFEATMFFLLLGDTLVENIELGSLRGAALCFIIEIFHCYPTQRPSIVNEILITLEGRSTFKPKSPRFKLPDGGNIRLISALIMRIIQSTVNGSGKAKVNRPNRHLSIESISTDDALETCENKIVRPSLRTDDGNEKRTALQLLAALASPLLDTATEIALQVVASMLNGAFCSVEASSCNPLYIFTEDLLKALVRPEWPAAELLLRLLLFQTVRVLQWNKTAPIVKLMAIDVLGLMGQAISSLNFEPQILATTISDDSVDNAGRSRLNNLIAWKGPFHVSLAYLQARKSLDPQASSAARYLIAQWALKVIAVHKLMRDTDQLHAAGECDSVAKRLQIMATNNPLLLEDIDVCCASKNVGAAYRSILLHSRFCESFERMLHNILLSATNPQASIRCRSLKALLPILEADHFIIDHTPIVKTLILRSINDTSVSVRVYSLRLIGRCVELKPELGLEMMPDILSGVLDQSIVIRKRAIKILKGIYLRSQEMGIKSGVARTLLRLVVDYTVREVVYQTIEDIWISPFAREVPPLKATPLFRPPLIDHLNLMSYSIRRDHHMANRFIVVLQAILSNAKSTAALQVLALFVAQICDMVANNFAADSGGLMDRGATFELLAIFARTNASVFTTKQIQILQPYINKVDAEEDIRIYRSTISVLYHALPLVPDVSTTCLRLIKLDLIRHIRVNRLLLNEVIPCLRETSEILQDNKPLINLAISCLENIRKMVGVDLQDPAAHEAVRKVTRLLNIAGMCGKHCNFEAELESFRMRCAGWSGNSITEHMISTFTLFSSSRQPMSVREAAMDAICMVCYSWPEHFTSATVHIQLKDIFKKEEKSLLEIVLKSFKEFFLAIEKHPGVHEDGNIKLDDVAGGAIDRAVAFIMQRFCKYVMEIALATQGGQGLLAVEVLASMNRQGIIHPKECAAICIALETSQNREIVELSLSMHEILQSKFEAVMQKQYMRAVYAAYKYQRDVVRNVRGATYDPYTSVLHRMVEVLNTGKVKTRKKLYQDLCDETDLDLSQTSDLDMRQYLQRSLFILENLAFFEYASVDELDATTMAMEKVFAGALIVVTHAIETEILGGTLPADKSEGIDSRRLCVLAAFSAVLSSIRDTKTYLRQQYDLSGSASKAPMRRDTVNGRSFWLKISTIMATLDSRENMLALCYDFVFSIKEDTGPNASMHIGLR